MSFYEGMLVTMSVMLVGVIGVTLYALWLTGNDDQGTPK